MDRICSISSTEYGMVLKKEGKEEEVVVEDKGEGKAGERKP